MSVRNLKPLFEPGSIAVIGASDKPRAVGGLVLRNILAAGFSGPVLPVNPNYPTVHGLASHPDVTSLPLTPDLAVVCTPPAVVPRILEELGALGAGAAVVVSSGSPSRRDAAGGDRLRQVCSEAARRFGMRVLGPNCLGLMVPGAGLNATFAHIQAAPGRLALISQSGAICTAILDFAASSGIGFSHFVSLGDCADVDAATMLDYLSLDPDTEAVLLYLESVRAARPFLSAARAAAREKPVLVIKAGRFEAGAGAARTHTGALTGADYVFDAAIRRAGMLRVFEIDELFDAVETLGRTKRNPGERLAILTNGGGPGVVAVDTLVAAGGVPAALSPATIAGLDAVLPVSWSGGNPVDLAGDADAERYAAALRLLLADSGVDAVLVLYVPTSILPAEEAAEAVAEVAASSRKNVLTSFMGREAVRLARDILGRRGLPTFETPSKAVRAFMHMRNYMRNQETLMQTPPSIPEDFTPEAGLAGRILRQARDQGREVLTEPEAKQVLSAYGIPVAATRLATSPVEAADAASDLGFPVTLRIITQGPACVWERSGVKTGLLTPGEVLAACAELFDIFGRPGQSARSGQSGQTGGVAGVAVRREHSRPHARDLMAGVVRDPVFGPVIVFGQGGPAARALGQIAAALPPLNLNLARELIARSGLSPALGELCDEPAVDQAALELLLTRLSQLILDFPEISGLAIDRLLSGPDGVLAVEASMSVAGYGPEAEAAPAIRPYPRELEETVLDRNGAVLLLRPIRPEDEHDLDVFLRACTPEDIRYRFFSLVREFTHGRLARFTQIDYGRDMNFVAVDQDGHILGMAGASAALDEGDGGAAEFGLIVRSDAQGRGVGRALMARLISALRAGGTRVLTGQVLRENSGMLTLAARLGFKKRFNYAGGFVEIHLDL